MLLDQGALSLLKRVPSLSYVTVGHANAAGITIPAAAQPGDFAVLVDTPVDGSTAPTLVIPAGFASVYDGSFSGTSKERASFSGKILVTGDPGSSITGMTGGAASRKSVMIFRPISKPFSAFTGGGGVGVLADGDPAAQTINVAGQGVPIIACAVGYSSGTVDLSSSQLTVVATDALTRALAYSILRDSATNQQFDMSDVGTNNLLAGCYFTLR